MGRRRQIADSVRLALGRAGEVDRVAYTVAANREIAGTWQPGETGITGELGAWANGLLRLDLSEDRQYLLVTLYQQADERADLEKVGALALAFDEADLLGRALLARVPSGEDWLGQNPGQGLIGLRIPPGL